MTTPYLNGLFSEIQFSKTYVARQRTGVPYVVACIQAAFNLEDTLLELESARTNDGSPLFDLIELRMDGLWAHLLANHRRLRTDGFKCLKDESIRLGYEMDSLYIDGLKIHEHETWIAQYMDGVVEGVRLTQSYLKQLMQSFHCPIILTLRTTLEGGQLAIGDEAYQFIMRQLIKQLSPYVLLDIEIDRLGDHDLAILNEIRSRQIGLILSHHAFDEPLSADALKQKVDQMTVYSPTIFKIASIANAKSDVDAMLKQSQCMFDLDRPMVGISMGDIGRVTRWESNGFSPPLSYCAVRKKTAPGQLTVIEANQLKSIRQINHPRCPK